MPLLPNENNPIPSAPRPAVSQMPSPARPATAAGGFGGLRVSLMPSELEGGRPPELGRRVLILILVLIVETIVIGGLNFWLVRNAAQKAAEGDDLRRRAETVASQIADQADSLAGVLTLDRQVRSVRETLEGHLYWTKFFAFLENNTRPNVIYERFGGEADSGIFTIDILGQSYRDVAEQIVVYRDNPLVASVRTTAASARVGQAGVIEGVGATMVIKLKPAVWLKPAAPAK